MLEGSPHHSIFGFVDHPRLAGLRGGSRIQGRIWRASFLTSAGHDRSVWSEIGQRLGMDEGHNELERRLYTQAVQRSVGFFRADMDTQRVYAEVQKETASHCGEVSEQVKSATCSRVKPRARLNAASSSIH